MGETLPSQDENPFFRIRLKTEIRFFSENLNNLFSLVKRRDGASRSAAADERNTDALFCESSCQERHPNDFQIVNQSGGFASLGPGLVSGLFVCLFFYLNQFHPCRVKLTYTGTLDKGNDVSTSLLLRLALLSVGLSLELFDVAMFLLQCLFSWIALRWPYRLTGRNTPTAVLMNSVSLLSYCWLSKLKKKIHYV